MRLPLQRLRIRGGGGDHVLAARPPAPRPRGLTGPARDSGKARGWRPAELGLVAHPEDPSNIRPGAGRGQEEGCSFPIFLTPKWPKSKTIHIFFEKPNPFQPINPQLLTCLPQSFQPSRSFYRSSPIRILPHDGYLAHQPPALSPFLRQSLF